MLNDFVIEYISWVFVGIALIGSVYNSRLDQYLAFRIWFVSNLFFVIFNIYFQHYGVAALYGCHWLLTIHGINNTKKIKAKKERMY